MQFHQDISFSITWYQNLYYFQFHFLYSKKTARCYSTWITYLSEQTDLWTLINLVPTRYALNKTSLDIIRNKFFNSNILSSVVIFNIPAHIKVAHYTLKWFLQSAGHYLIMMNSMKIFRIFFNEKSICMKFNLASIYLLTTSPNLVTEIMFTCIFADSWY